MRKSLAADRSAHNRAALRKICVSRLYIIPSPCNVSLRRHVQAPARQALFGCSRRAAQSRTAAMASGDWPKDSSSTPTINQPLLPAVALEDGWLTPPGQLLPREPAAPPPAPRKRRCMGPQAEWSPRAEHLPLWDAYFRASDDRTPALPGGSSCAPRRTQRKLTKVMLF